MMRRIQLAIVACALVACAGRQPRPIEGLPVDGQLPGEQDAPGQAVRSVGTALVLSSIAMSLVPTPEDQRGCVALVVHREIAASTGLALMQHGGEADPVFPAIDLDFTPCGSLEAVDIGAPVGEAVMRVSSLIQVQVDHAQRMRCVDREILSASVDRLASVANTVLEGVEAGASSYYFAPRSILLSKCVEVPEG